jgi:hypothetical protein
MPDTRQDIMPGRRAESSPCDEMRSAAPVDPPEDVLKEMRTLIRFIEFYCARKHRGVPRSAVTMKCLDIAAIAGHPVSLCADCGKLCMHAATKRAACPLDPKPQCKHCPEHCYHPRYREKIREVMRFSGMRLVLRGRLDYLAHLLF